MIDLREHVGRVVPFVGAGASYPPPSNLPTWNGFNSLLIECLCERLDEYCGGRQPTGEILSRLNARRDEARFFSPDFQAQLMEEEVGPAYFSVLQSLDTAAFGPSHAHLAQLVSEGRVAAIITTNFDRLIEFALDARAQPYRVFHNEASFKAFALSGDCAGGSLPIIKIHGSVEDPASLVDTLRQRVVGRPPALQTILDRLLREHVWLFLGFSGADLSYNHNYLNILDSAPEARGFCFVARDADTIEEGVQRLADAYGDAKASIGSGRRRPVAALDVRFAGRSDAFRAGRRPQGSGQTGESPDRSVGRESRITLGRQHPLLSAQKCGLRKRRPLADA